MNFGVFRQYYELQTNGLVPTIACGNDKLHLGLVPNMDSEDKIFLYCLECDYKKFPGSGFYNSMKIVLSGVEVANVG
jgi:hypothetical protein